MKDWLLTWFKAARAPFLIVSILPCILGGTMAYARGFFDWSIFLLASIGIVMAHSAADFVDDYFDFLKGNLGNKVQQFHDSPLIDGRISLKQILIAITLCLMVSLIAGIILWVKVGAPVLLLTAFGLVAVFFYTSPPLKLNYRGLGETVLFLAFGPLIVFGVWYVLSGKITIEPLFISVVPGIFTMNVGVVSNTFDYHDDVKSGKRTLSVRFGQAAAWWLITLSTVAAYLVIIFGVILDILPLSTLWVLLTFPLAVNMLFYAKRYEEQSRYTPAMGRIILLSATATILLTASYWVEAWRS